MEKYISQKTTVVNIEGWELELFDEPQKIQSDLTGEMLQFKGIWLSEPERGLVTILTKPEKIFYIEISESELPLQKVRRKNKVTPIKITHNKTNKDKED